MSVTSALNNALSGLTATSRQAEVVSNNVANATTPGYARRSVGLSSMSLGGMGAGVRVTGILRHSDLFLVNDRRGAAAALAASQTSKDFLIRAEQIFGTTESEGSLVNRVAAFETALLSAASRPDSEARLSAAVSAADSLARGLTTASKAIQTERARADTRIAALVDRLNDGLRQVEALNIEIASFNGPLRDPSALIDQRQQIIDQISQILPIRELPREGNRVALITTGGAMLLDSKAAEFSFTAVHAVVADMSLASGSLSGLQLNGKEIATSGAASPIRGGELAALFALRDDSAVEAQAMLDAMARDLVERFSAADPTLAPGEPGIFTDSGGAFDPADELGLASRLRINPLLDLADPATLHRLRDGLNAALPGPPGDGSLLSDLAAASSTPRQVSSPLLAGSRSLPGLAADILSRLTSDRLTAEASQAFDASRYYALSDLEAAQGVNTEEEMAALLVIERSYAANARVLQAVDEMIKTLLGL